jgi:hypothetical protein
MTYEEFLALDVERLGEGGDDSNARYWYGRVGEPVPELTLEEEWLGLVRRFL